MTYGALITVTTADVEHAREAINDVSNVGLLNWERQSLKPYIHVHTSLCIFWSLVYDNNSIFLHFQIFEFRIIT